MTTERQQREPTAEAEAELSEPTAETPLESERWTAHPMPTPLDRPSDTPETQRHYTANRELDVSASDWQRASDAQLARWAAEELEALADVRSQQSPQQQAAESERVAQRRQNERDELIGAYVSAIAEQSPQLGWLDVMAQAEQLADGELAAHAEHRRDADIAELIEARMSLVRACWIPEHVEPPEPCLIDAAGRTMLYGRSRTVLYAMPGAGKSWAALALARCAERAVVVAPDGYTSWIHRGMRLCDAHPDVRERIAVVDHTDLDTLDALRWWLSAVGPRGVIIYDSATELGSPTDGTNITDWAERVTGLWREACPAAAELMIDHTAKTIPEGAAHRTPLGSVAKLGRVDAAYEAVATTTSDGHLDAVELHARKRRDDWIPHRLSVSLCDGVPTAHVAHVVDATRLERETAALDDVAAGMSQREAAQRHGVAATTLRRRLEAQS